MDDSAYADIRAALQFPDGTSLEWQITQVRLVGSLVSGQLQSLERRLEALETSNSTPLLKEEKPLKEDNFVWKNKAVVYSILGIIAFVGEAIVQLIFSYVESRLHLK